MRCPLFTTAQECRDGGCSMERKNLVRLLSLAAMALGMPLAHAGCSGEYRGQSGSFEVSVSDNGCQYNERMLQVRPHTNPTDPPEVVIPFDQVCKENKGGIACSSSAPQPMRGVRYRWTQDTNPSCPGDKAGNRLTCVSGCSVNAPKYLYASPYEC